MAAFSVSEAAFSGFRVVREHPVALAIWAPILFAYSIGADAFTAFSAGPAAEQLKRVGIAAVLQNPAAVSAAERQFLPTQVILLIGAMIISAVFAAAINRAILKPTEQSFGFVRLAAAELRQLGLLALLLAMVFGLYLAVASACLLAAVALRAAFGAAGLSMAVAAGLVGLVVALVYFGVRFSLAAPLAFDRRRISLIGSWRLTQHHFWPMLGAFVMALTLSILVSALTSYIADGVVALVGGAQAATAAAEPNFSTLATALTPLRILYQAVVAFGAALATPITLGPPAAIYRALTGGERWETGVFA